MTAADVKYSFERVLDPKSKSEGALDRRPASPDEARQILGLRGREAGQVPLVQVRRKGGLETTAIKPDLAHQ